MIKSQMRQQQQQQQQQRSAAASSAATGVTAAAAAACTQAPPPPPPYDARSVDAWAMGVLLYLLVTGTYPFEVRALWDLRAHVACMRVRVRVCQACSVHICAWPSPAPHRMYTCTCTCAHAHARPAPPPQPPQDSRQPNNLAATILNIQAGRCQPLPCHISDGCRAVIAGLLCADPARRTRLEVRWCVARTCKPPAGCPTACRACLLLSLQACCEQQHVATPHAYT
jgi:hypothetical protein